MEEVVPLQGGWTQLDRRTIFCEHVPCEANIKSWHLNTIHTYWQIQTQLSGISTLELTFFNSTLSEFKILSILVFKRHGQKAEMPLENNNFVYQTYTFSYQQLNVHIHASTEPSN